MSTTFSHLRPSGRLGRNTRLAAASGLIMATVFLPAALLWLQQGLHGFAFIAVAILTALGWAWIRAPFVRISMLEDAMVVRSWWTKHEIPREEVRVVRAQTYGGFFYMVGWPVASGVLESGELVIETSQGTERTLPGSVTSLLIAKQQAGALNRWIGIEPGPRRSRR